MAHGDFKDLPRRTITDKILNCDGDQRGFASIVYKFFDKKTSNTNRGTGINSDIVSENKELDEEL